MFSNLQNSLKYIEENSTQIFDPSYPIIMDEIKTIVDSKDKFYVDSLSEIIKKRCYELTCMYYERYVKNTVYDIEMESLKRLEEFWGIYSEFHLNKKFIKKNQNHKEDGDLLPTSMTQVSPEAYPPFR